MSIAYIDMENICRRSFYVSHGDIVEAAKMFFLMIRAFLNSLKDPRVTPIFLVDDYVAQSSWRSKVHKNYVLTSAPTIMKEYIQTEARMHLIELLGSYGMNIRVVAEAEWFDLLCQASRDHLIVEPTYILTDQICAYQFIRDDARAPILLYEFSLNDKKEFKWDLFVKSDLETQYQIPIDLLPFYIAIHGDKGHGVKGIKGIGPKRGQRLVKEIAKVYPDVPRLTDIEELDGHVAHTLLSHFDTVREIVQCYHPMHIPEQYRVTLQSPVIDLFHHEHKYMREQVMQAVGITSEQITELTKLAQWEY